MGKKLSKGEKLDVILSELSKLKGEIKLLAKLQAALAEQIAKPQARKSVSRPARKPAKKPAAAAHTRKSGAAPKRPVLVASPEASASSPRTAAQ